MKSIKRRSFIGKTTALLGLFGIGIPVLKAKSILGNEKGFTHIVFFWLKDPDNKEDNERFLNNLKRFINEVDEIQTKHVGTPADTSRSVIDNSYSYCLVVTFKNKEDHDIYQEHPKHKRFIETSEDLWERVLVYDSIPVLQDV